MCVKLPSRDLNPDPYPPHPTSIYTYGVTTAPRVRGEQYFNFYWKKHSKNKNLNVEKPKVKP